MFSRWSAKRSAPMPERDAGPACLRNVGSGMRTRHASCLAAPVRGARPPVGLAPASAGRPALRAPTVAANSPVSGRTVQFNAGEAGHLPNAGEAGHLPNAGECAETEAQALLAPAEPQGKREGPCSLRRQ